MKPFSVLALAILISLPAGAVLAHDGPHDQHAGHAAQAADMAAAMVDGEVKKIDKNAGKITLRHGEIKNLGMAAMTMAFKVKDPAMLDQVKLGAKVRFMADKVNGAITVVHLENVQ